MVSEPFFQLSHAVGASSISSSASGFKTVPAISSSSSCYRLYCCCCLFALFALSLLLTSCCPEHVGKPKFAVSMVCPFRWRLLHPFDGTQPADLPMIRNAWAHRSHVTTPLGVSGPLVICHLRLLARFMSIRGVTPSMLGLKQFQARGTRRRDGRYSSDWWQRQRQ